MSRFLYQLKYEPALRLLSVALIIMYRCLTKGITIPKNNDVMEKLHQFIVGDVNQHYLTRLL